MNVLVWDCRFYMQDDNGNDVVDKHGHVKIFRAPDLDWSYIAEYVEVRDLVEDEE